MVASCIFLFPNENLLLGLRTHLGLVYVNQSKFWQQCFKCPSLSPFSDCCENDNSFVCHGWLLLRESKEAIEGRLESAMRGEILLTWHLTNGPKGWEDGRKREERSLLNLEEKSHVSKKNRVLINFRKHFITKGNPRQTSMKEQIAIKVVFFSR